MKAKTKIVYKPTNIRLESSLHTKASELAFKTGRSLSKMIELFVRHGLEAGIK